MKVLSFQSSRILFYYKNYNIERLRKKYLTFLLQIPPKWILKRKNLNNLETMPTRRETLPLHWIIMEKPYPKGRVKTYINGCIFKIHPLRYTVKYTSTGVFSKIGKFWNYTLWSIKRQNCLCTATGVFSKMKCLILFQKFYESICIWMSNTWIRNTWLLE